MARRPIPPYRSSLLLLLAVLLAAPHPALGQAATPGPKLSSGPRLQEVRIPGSLPEARPAAVLLPRDYDTGARRYPVLYLLHGLWGSWVDWPGRTNVAAYTADLPLIVVMPDASDSWYVNSATDSTQRYEDYIGTDVVQWVDAHYRTLPYPQARFIAGLSMGGYGALALATKHPGRFSLAASISGAFTPVREWTHESVVAAFGPVGSPARKKGDLATLLKAAGPAKLPYYYLDCGTSDPLITGSREVAAILSERQLPYEYHETHGAHEWEYWDRRLPVVLQLIGRRIARLEAERGEPAVAH